MKIYFINLDVRPDRKSTFLEQFKNSNLIVERIEAVSSEYLNHEVAPPSVSACWLSHQKAFRRFTQSKDKYALIFEDDAQVDSKFLEIIKKINIGDNLNFDLLQLGYLKDRNRITVDSGKIDYIFRLYQTFVFRTNYALNVVRNKYYQNVSQTNSTKSRYIEESRIRKVIGIKHPFVLNSIEAGAHCYVISQKLASALLGLNVNPVIIATDLLFIELSNSSKFSCARVSKSLCGQNSKLGSNIYIRSKGLLSEIKNKNI